MAKFQACKCGRSVPEQRAIHARMNCWRKLPESSKAEIKALIDTIAAEHYAPGAALLRVLRGEITAQGECARSRISYATMLDMVRDFYRRCPLR